MSKGGRVIILSTLALLVAACSADKSSAPTTASPPPTSATEPTATSGTPTVITLEPPLVSRVIDGDTIDLDSGERIRLVQIDAPESKGECYGKKAANVLRQLLPVGTEVRIVRDPKLDNIDRYGRLLRYVYRGETKNINLILVQKGAASVWYFHGDKGRYADALLAAAKRASATKRGLWGACEAKLDPLHAVATAPKRNEPNPTTTQQSGCEPGYSPCLPITGDLDCADVQAMGLAPVTVTGSDRYRLDGNGDGVGCE